MRRRPAGMKSCRLLAESRHVADGVPRYGPGAMVADQRLGIGLRQPAGLPGGVKAIAALSALIPAPEPGAPADRRFLHYDESRSFEVLDEALGDDLRHELGRVMLPLAAFEPEREGERARQVVG
jgi:hypothetical protein